KVLAVRPVGTSGRERLGKLAQRYPSEQSSHSQLAGLQYRQWLFGQLQAAVVHRGGAESHLERLAEPNRGTAHGQRPDIPDQSERHRVRQWRAGERGWAG